MGATNPNAGGAPGGGGKGGMQRNPGPGGNAQNNPGVGQTMGPNMSAWANMGQQHLYGNPRPMPYSGMGALTPIQGLNGGGGQLTPIQGLNGTAMPQRAPAGLPAGGILAKLYGG